MSMIKKVLVIDDNTVNLATVEKALKGKYEVIPMISGKRALKYLYCQTVDLILLDVEMPEMSGVETLEEIRKLDDGAKTPVIFLTAKKDKQTVLDGFRLNIMDYITKPFDVDNLSERVEYTLKRAGQLPFDKLEIYKIVEVMIQDIEKQDFKKVITKLVESLNYKTDDEVLGRFRNALNKFRQNDQEGAVSMIYRTYRMLQAELEDELKIEQTLNKEQIKELLSDILKELDDYKTKEALAKCKEAAKHNLPQYIMKIVNNCIDLLNQYDDEEAEKLLKSIVSQLN